MPGAVGWPVGGACSCAARVFAELRIAGTCRWPDAATAGGDPAEIRGPASNARSQIWKDATTPATTSAAQSNQGSRLRIAAIIVIWPDVVHGDLRNLRKNPSNGGPFNHPYGVFPLTFCPVQSKIGRRQQFLGAA